MLFSLLFLPIICGLVLFFIRFVGGLVETPHVVGDFAKSIAGGAWGQSFFAVLLRVPVVLMVVVLMVFVFGFLLIRSKGSGKWSVMMPQLLLLVMPHICVAVALSFLLFPTGLLSRIFQGLGIGGYEYMGMNGPLLLALVFKMLPFVALSLFHQVRDQTVLRQYQFAQTLGHNEGSAWTIVVFPQILYKLIPLLCVVAVYSLSPVDLSFILGPRSPATPGVRIQQFIFLPFAELQLQARIAAVLLVAVSLCFVGAVWKLSVLLDHRVSSLSTWGAMRIGWEKFFLWFGRLSNVFFVVGAAVIVVILYMWSFAGRWQHPSLFPQEWSSSGFVSTWNILKFVMLRSLIIAGCSATIGVIGAVCIHELMRFSRIASRVFFVVLGFLLIPDIFKSISINDFFLLIGRQGHDSSVIWAHVQTVLPYCYVVLYGALSRFNYEYMHSVYMLGKNYFQAITRVYFPLLLPEIILAFLFGMLVSLGQYTSTVFVGGGRVQTLVLWLVSLSSGRDRRLLANSGVLLMIIQFALMLCAVMILVFFRKSSILRAKQ